MEGEEDRRYILDIDLLFYFKEKYLHDHVPAICCKSEDNRTKENSSHICTQMGHKSTFFSILLCTMKLYNH